MLRTLTLEQCSSLVWIALSSFLTTRFFFFFFFFFPSYICFFGGAILFRRAKFAPRTKCFFLRTVRKKSVVWFDLIVRRGQQQQHLRRARARGRTAKSTTTWLIFWAQSHHRAEAKVTTQHLVFLLYAKYCVRRAQTKHARHISHRSAAACIQQQQCCTEWTVFSNTDKQTNGCAQADIRRVRRAIEREGGEESKFQLQLMYFSSQRSSGGLRKDDEEGSRTSNVRANDDEWSRGAALGAQKAHHCCCCKQIKKAAALFCVLLSKCFLLIFIRACALFLMRGKHCSQIAHRFSGEGEETLSLSLFCTWTLSTNKCNLFL